MTTVNIQSLLKDNLGDISIAIVCKCICMVDKQVQQNPHKTF